MCQFWLPQPVAAVAVAVAAAASVAAAFPAAVGAVLATEDTFAE